METFAGLQRFAAERLDDADRASTAQTAVIVSDASVARMRQDAALSDALVFRQMLECGALGAPFDTYRVEDLETLFAQPGSANYRFLIFLDTLYLSPRQRGTVERRVKRDGRTVLWVYAAGLVTDEGFSAEAMRDLTGFRLAFRRATDFDLPMVNSFLTGTRVVYGTERILDPIVCGEDAEATAAGWFVNTGDPGLLTRDFGGWRSVWSGAPAVPAVVLRHLARQAGVHLYVETGDQVLAGREFLAIHAGSDGERTVRLPAPCDVREADNGGWVGRGVAELRVKLRRGQTAIWNTTPVGTGGGGP
jgi:hypothetical protein